MFDFGVTECSRSMYLYCLLFYLLIVIVFYRKYSVCPEEVSCVSKLNPLLGLLVLAYILTSFYNGDFWHYQDFVFDNDSFFAPSEEVYKNIAKITGNNYLFFRIAVWGTAYYFLIRIFKIIRLNVNVSLLYFFTLYISVFDYARASLAMVIYFISYIFTVNPNSKISTKLIGWMGIVGSYFFHHSMIVLILLTFMRYIPINKKTVTILFFLVPAIVLMVDRVFTSVMGMSWDAFELVIMKMENFSEFEGKTDRSFLEKVRLFWHYSTFYIPFVIITYKLIFESKVVHSPHVLKLYNITLGIILFATSTLFLGFRNNVLFYRTLYMSMIPLTILICYLHETRVIQNRTFKRLMLLGIGYSVFRHSKILLRWGGPIK